MQKPSFSRAEAPEQSSFSHVEAPEQSSSSHAEAPFINSQRGFRLRAKKEQPERFCGLYLKAKAIIWS